MTEEEALRVVIAQLECSGVDYVLVGGLACNLYGIPRFTSDADFVCRIRGLELDGLLDALPEKFEIDPQARMELFTGTMRWVVQTPAPEFKIEFFLLGEDPHHHEEFARRRRTWLPAIELEAWIATAEDLIIQKLRWARGKDLDDVRNIVSVQGQALDFDYLQRWSETHGTSARFAEVRASIPPGL